MKDSCREETEPSLAFTYKAAAVLTQHEAYDRAGGEGSRQESTGLGGADQERIHAKEHQVVWEGSAHPFETKT